MSCEFLLLRVAFCSVTRFALLEGTGGGVEFHYAKTDSLSFGICFRSPDVSVGGLVV
jgi:hypothetical protein